MKTVLLTGFESFLDHSLNPTESIVQSLDGQQIGGYNVVGRVLPVTFEQAGEELLAYYEEHQPDVVISLGLAAGRHKITPERIAINVQDGAPDNNGHTPVDAPIHPEGNDAYFSTLPIRRMVETLGEQGIPADVSNTAGTYVCNHVMYTMLHTLHQKGGHTRAGFIHIPASFELASENKKIPGWPLAMLQEAVQLIIQSLEE